MNEYGREIHRPQEIAYLGWDYHGLASQLDTENTIEVLLNEECPS